MTGPALLRDAELAATFAPQLLLDAAEPYRPHALGYTIFRHKGQSPSSAFAVEPVASLVIEYAVYYDWDIGHLYDLEHVWVHVDGAGRVVRVEASSHGRRRVMDIGSGLPQMRDSHCVLYVEAGKHAHWAAPHQMTLDHREKLAALCGPLAGAEGVHLGNDFAKAGAYRADPSDHRLAGLKMRGDAFRPTHHYRPLDAIPTLMPWAELAEVIPGRVEAEMARLRREQPHFGAVFLDCGDTLIDERTEVKLPDSEVVVRAELIPGARDMPEALKAAGHRLILVADGPRQTFVNVLTQHGLWDYFDAHIISEDIGVHKPDARMFDTAMAAAGLSRADAWRVVMVGNNLSRDIAGARALGITAVFMAWSSLRTHEPAHAGEVPDYKIMTPAQFPPLLEQLEFLLRFRIASEQMLTVR